MHTAVGILFLLIIVLAIWLLFFNNIITEKKTAIDETWDQITSLFLDRDELLDKLAQRASLTGQKPEALEGLAPAKRRFMEAKSADQLITSSQKLSEKVKLLQSAFLAHPYKDEDPVSASLLLQLTELEEKLSGRLELYQDTAAKYNRRLNVFPNNLATFILGKKPLS